MTKLETLEMLVEQNNRQVSEVWTLFKKTDEKIDKLTKNVNRVTGELENVKMKWGKFVEYILAPGIPKAFQKIGIEILGTSQRAKRPGIEIDILGVNHDCVVAVEVKSTLSVDDVKHFLGLLPKFKTAFSEYKNKIVYGAVAGIEITGKADEYAYRKGLFVLTQAGDSVCIANDKKFRPMAW